MGAQGYILGETNSQINQDGEKFHPVYDHRSTPLSLFICGVENQKHRILVYILSVKFPQALMPSY